MGAGLTRLLTRVLPDAGQGSAWQRNARGPTLRKLFGAYANPDLWTVSRRLKKLDELGSGDGWLTYTDMQELLHLPEFHLLFIWDIFSQQNELVLGRELLATICIFSSAKLKEKGRFLHGLFAPPNTSNVGTSLCTGAELAELCTAFLGVLAKCTGTLVKPKEVANALRSELPSLIPDYREAVARRGGDRQASDRCFTEEPIIGQGEMDRLCLTLQANYQDLPVAGPPPMGALKPPPPDWDEEAEYESLNPAGKGPSFVVAKASAAGGGPAAVRALTASRQAASPQKSGWRVQYRTEAEILRLEEEMDEAARAQSLAEEVARAAELAKLEAVQTKPPPPPARATLIIHGREYADVERDLASFRYLFVKGVAAALGIPAGCVEVLEVSKGSIKVDFRLHPTCRGGDFREGDDLVLELEEQLAAAKSPLRRGVFREYAASAELRRPPPGGGAAAAAEGGAADRELEAPRPTTGRRRTVRVDAGTQAIDLALTIEEALVLLREEEEKAQKAEAALNEVRKAIAERDADIAAIHRARAEEAARKAEAIRQAQLAELRRLQAIADAAADLDTLLLAQAAAGWDARLAETRRMEEEEQERRELQRREDEAKAAERGAGNDPPWAIRSAPPAAPPLLLRHPDPLLLGGGGPALLFF